MEQDSVLNHVDGVDRQLLVESGCRLVELEEQEFVNPVQDEVEETRHHIENGQARAVHEAGPKVGHQLSINIVA